MTRRTNVFHTYWVDGELQRIPPTMWGSDSLPTDPRVEVRRNEPFWARATFDEFHQTSKTTVAMFSLYGADGSRMGRAPMPPTFLAEVLRDPAFHAPSIGARWMVGRIGTSYGLVLAEDPMERARMRERGSEGGAR